MHIYILEVICIFLIKGIKKYIDSSVSYFNHLNPNIMIFIIYGLLYDTVLNLYKSFATKFLERLGASNLHITLYNSMPGVVAVVVLLPCLFIMSRFKKKKEITAVFILIGRLLILAMAFTPMLPDKWRPVVFVGLIALLNFPEAVSQAAMQSILGDMFNGKVRALALSSRNQFGNLFIMIITFVSGLIISFIPRSDSERILWYQVFFVAAFVIGLVEIRFFLKLDEKNNPDYSPATEKEEPPKLKDLLDIFKNRQFLSFTVLSIMFYMTFHGGWAISSIYYIKNLGATEIWLAIFAVTSGILSFIFAPWWNKFITKNGNNRALVLSCYIMGVNSLLIATSPNLYFLIFQCAFNGFGVVGLNVTLLNGLLISTPAKNRLLYIGLYNTIVNLSLGVSPLLVQVFMGYHGVQASLVLVGFSRIAVSSVLLYVFVFRNKEKVRG